MCENGGIINMEADRLLQALWIIMLMICKKAITDNLNLYTKKVCFMDLEKYTQKSIEAIKDAKEYCIEYGNQQMRQEHILYAMINSEEGLISEMISKLGADRSYLVSQFEKEIDKLPKVSGSGVDSERIYLSREADQALAEAEKLAEKMKDEYVSVEHIMLGILEKPQDNVKKILSGAGINVNSFLSALKDIRGNQRVTSDNPEDTYNVLKKYGQDLVAMARQLKLDPVIGRDDEIRNVIRIL